MRNKILGFLLLVTIMISAIAYKVFTSNNINVETFDTKENTTLNGL